MYGGLSNHLYYCALPSSVTPAANEPSEVLVRFYGQVHGEGALESLLAESVIFTLLSERRLGPRLYGVFPGGRLEQYIPARSLTTAELANPQISREVASKMAKMHAMNVPISKEPTWMWNCMKRWLKSSDEFLRTSSAPSNIDPTSKRHSMLEKLRQVDFEEELNFLKRIVTKIQSPVVFAHNDMQEGNILFNNNALRFSDKISLIDFEYCSYNHRGFDVANHFCEWVYFIQKPRRTVTFTHDIKAFPNKNQQLNFIRAYLTAYEAACGRKISQTSSESNGLNNGKNLVSSSESRTKTPCASHSENTSDNNDIEKETQLSVSHPAEEKLLQEVQVFTLTSHLFWTLWSIVQGHVSEIPFGYLVRIWLGQIESLQ
ncbi:Choline/ethanolamine kinase [Armadillidium nasatum]|uniref:Choline/ethanolamine kinase n=1 Tax=Armadillidium nasatum TaxID=96803 RepID=A0A5N5SV79_9CRUS|nr:Choline/ethanolamine kinase [Armadillidium nasatum]